NSSRVQFGLRGIWAVFRIAVRSIGFASKVTACSDFCNRDLRCCKSPLPRRSLDGPDSRGRLGYFGFFGLLAADERPARCSRKNAPAIGRELVQLLGELLTPDLPIFKHYLALPPTCSPG